MLASNSFKKHPAHKALYDALIQSLFVDEDDMDQAAATMNQSALLKRKHDDQDEDPTAGSNQGKEKKRPRKDTQPLKKSSTSKESCKDEEHMHAMSLDAEENIVDEMGNADEQPDDPEWNTCQVVDDQPEQPWFNDLVSAQKDPLTFDELMATLIDFSKFAKNRLKLENITKADLVGPVYTLLKCTYQSNIELEYNMEECNKVVYVILALEYFFNNDLEYLKSIDSERKYTTLITNTKAARYELVGIEDMISKQWSVTKASYDKDAELRIKHWGPILSVVSVMVNKLHGYLEEIMVRRADRQLYKFKEGDFVNLHLNDIEDMLLLVVQHKIFHLNGEVIVDLAIALRMLTGSLIIKKRVEDVQLGVESYQKKLNITKPQKDVPRIFAKELYTPSFDPLGVVYEDLRNQKRLMRADELYKFSDGTLKKVPNTLHHRLLNFSDLAITKKS
ncbi:hypothetical protein Tco_1214198 [Tanacetum coccineum]